MSDILDVIDRLARMSYDAADRLRTQIATAQAVLDRLDAFTKGAEEVGQLAAASDLFPTWSANIPDAAGLVRTDEGAARERAKHEALLSRLHPRDAASAPDQEEH
jgi:hypothetical protein